MDWNKMKISELIKYLKKLKDKHGDVECFTFNKCEEPAYITTVEYQELKAEFDMYKEEYRPKDGVYRGVFIDY